METLGTFWQPGTLVVCVSYCTCVSIDPALGHAFCFSVCVCVRACVCVWRFQVASSVTSAHRGVAFQRLREGDSSHELQALTSNAMASASEEREAL